jgi:hypothetical protein
MTDHFDVPVVATGDWIDAAFINQYWGDNFRAIFQAFTATGMIPYAVDADTIGGLAKPSVDAVLKNTSAGALSWKAMTDFFPGTAAGDVDYYSASQVKTRLAIGAANTVLKSNGSIPAWASMVSSRQGGNANEWAEPGTTSYTPPFTYWEAGVISISVTAGVGNVTITFPNAFSIRPLVLITVESDPRHYAIAINNLTASAFRISVLELSGADSVTIKAHWIALGQ